MYQGGAPGYKATGRSRIYDSKTTINTINYPHVYMLHLLNLDRSEWAGIVLAIALVMRLMGLAALQWRR